MSLKLALLAIISRPSYWLYLLGLPSGYGRVSEAFVREMMRLHFARKP